MRVANSRSSRVRQRAFTFTEAMVATGLFSMVMVGVIYSHLTGNRLYYILQAKIGSAEQSRQTLAKLNDEIRTSKRVVVGTGSASSFSAFADGSAQAGNALQIYPGTNTNTFIRYYRDSGTSTVRRKTSASATVDTIAQNVTNAVVFTAEEYNGMVVTNNLNNRVIRVEMMFDQIVIPKVLVGPGNLYETYRIRSRITRRALE